jgi:chemotaxis methyl-accepting protein methylase
VLETFDQRMRAVVLDRLTASLTPNGWLALSPDEAPPPGFSAVGPGLFRRKAVMSVAA